LLQGYQVRVCQPQAVFGQSFESTTNGLAKWLGYIDKYLLFPLALKKSAQWADIIHICDHSNAMYVPHIKKRAHLVTCHDLMAVRSARGEFEDNNKIGKTGQLQQQWIVHGLQAAEHVASVSIAKVPALRLLSNYGITENMRFLLHVGGNQWYKNRKGLIAIFNQIIQQQPDTDLKLVMAGKSLTDELHELIQQYELQDRVIEVIEPSTEELAALYSLTTAFIFPSLCEGFGWPIIEAQACNALVFTSNREPMTEVGGDAAIYIDPETPDQAASIISAALDNDALIQKTLKANAANLLQFSADLMVERYVSLYKAIIAKHTLNK
jgi:glycosyltransferase involved in cell wall biosynthesis